MRLIAIVLSVAALLFASGAIAQTTSDKSQQKNVEVEHPGWYEENIPYRPCPSRLQSMAATFVSAAPDDVPGLRHSPQTTDKGDKQVAAEYREKTPYRPLSDRGCNGRNVCLGCPGRRPGPPSFGP